jgi:hypothetical protein
VARSADHEAFEAARAEIAEVADEFRAAAHPALTSALERRVDALTEARGEWWNALAPEVRTAFRDSVARAIAAGVDDVVERLADTGLWEAPLTAPGAGPPERGMEGAPGVGWLSGAIRRVVGGPSPATLGNLDDPSNRIWVAMSTAARPLDPILEEFGLPASASPDPGGGHHGLQPRTAAQLDPTGGLTRIWKRYRLAYQRFAALEADLGPRA